MSRSSVFLMSARAIRAGSCAGLLAALLSVSFVHQCRALSVRPLDVAAHLSAATGVCRGAILGNTIFKDADGRIHTRTAVRVDETFKGVFPAIVSLVHRGGVVGNEGEADSGSPEFTVGEERLLFLAQRPDGTLFAVQGPHSARKLMRATATSPGAARVTGPAPFLPPDEGLLQSLRLKTDGQSLPGGDLTGQATAAPPKTAARLAASHGALSGHALFSGTPSRFVQCDRYEPISYLIDMSVLPTGISSNQAFQAVTAALNVWSAVSSVRFRFEGVQSFGMAAANVPATDGKLRIQLHDQHNFINSPGTLGQGGSGVTSLALSAGWGTGGNVAGHEFLRITRGFAVIEHGDSAFNSNPALLAEIVCHEVGHALGLAHSSNTFPEANPTLAEALMYFQAHNDGRGATLGTYDPPILRQAYPQTNTPPASFNRMMDIVTITNGTPTVPGVNEIELRGYDLQNTSLTIETNDAATGNIGVFNLTGSTLKFNPAGFVFTPERLDPAGGAAFARVYYRHSDGTNASALGEVKILSFKPDQHPGNSDGIPDDWQQAHFGQPNPDIVAGAKPGDDPDGDGFTNLQEYRLGTLPNDFGHKLFITALSNTNLVWLATPYEQYEVQVSTTLTNWVILQPAVVPKTTIGSFNFFTNNAPNLFFKVIKVP